MYIFILLQPNNVKPEWKKSEIRNMVGIPFHMFKAIFLNLLIDT